MSSVQNHKVKNGRKPLFNSAGVAIWRNRLREPKMNVKKLAKELGVKYQTMQKVLIKDAYGEL